MMNKSYVMAVILSLAGLLVGTDALQARGHRGGCSGCYSSCHGCYSSCHGCYSSCHGCYSSCHSCYGCYGCSSYHSCHGCYSYGGCYGGYSGGYVYGGSYGSYVPYASSGTISNGSHPTPAVASTNGGSTAIVRVILPSPQATVWVDGGQTSSTGSVRVFQTPDLTTTGTYTIKASWVVDGREMTNERSVLVTSGQTSVVDFNQAQSGTQVATRP